MPRSELIGAHYSNVYLCVFAHKKKMLRPRACLHSESDIHENTLVAIDGGCANLCVIINQGMLVHRRRGAKKLFNSIISPRGASLCVMCRDAAEKTHVCSGLHCGFERALFDDFNSMRKPTHDCRSLAIKMMNCRAERLEIVTRMKECGAAGLRRFES